MGTTDQAAPILSSRVRGAGLTVGSPLDVAPGRIDLSVESATLEGFAAAPPLFDLAGLDPEDMPGRVERSGRRSWEYMVATSDACHCHAQRIEEEDRRDDVALVTMVRMRDDGTLEATHVDDGPGARPSAYKLTEDAFNSLVTRMQIPAAGRYLRQCWPALRAANVNGWIDRLASAELKASELARSAGRASEYAPIDMRIRHRAISRPGPGLEGVREIFGIVSPDYADLDADKLDQAIAMAAPAGSRGRVTYDGRRSRWEILSESTVQPKVGEPFRAGVILTTDDAGGGAINGHAIVQMPLCLNLIVIQTTATAHFGIRHVGDIEAMARKFRDGFGKALGSITHFVHAWDLAVEDDVVRDVRGASRRALPTSTDDVMAGIFRDAIERELVPVRGVRTEDAVRGLVQAWRADTSATAGTTRAAVANAFTRWAHTGIDADPWQEDLIQEGAGMLIKRTKKDDGWALTLGYLAPEDSKGR